MVSFFENTPEAGACILQMPLQRTWTDMQLVGIVSDGGTPPSQFLLYRNASDPTWYHHRGGLPATACTGGSENFVRAKLKPV